ncbi:hypothetical protein CS537_12310 [Yersinia mollaretii]|nr:hypothetical protein CS537_12310 [Yersinia mollaretii]
MPDIVAKLLFFFTSCTFTLSVHSDFMQHRHFRGAFFYPIFSVYLFLELKYKRHFVSHFSQSLYLSCY